MARTRVAIIGGGPGGYVAAIRAAQLGGDVTLIEKDALGGTCLNRGCIPTKALLQSANVLRQARRAGAFGVHIGNPSIDFAAASKRKSEIVSRLVDGVASLMTKNGISVINGLGTIVDRGEVRVSGREERTIDADRMIIATGSEPATVDIPGIDGAGVIDSDGALALADLPPSIVIIGGGVIGLEFAQMFHRMDTRATVVEMMPQVLPNEDAEIAGTLERSLRSEGIEILTGAALSGIADGPQGGKAVRFAGRKGEEERAADIVLVAVGRRPFTGGLGLDSLGIALDGRRIRVDGRMQTGVEGVYAIGDAVGGTMLAHAAMAQGRCAAENAMGMDSEMDRRAVPRCVYTSPEVAAVGLTERQAEDEYGTIKVGRFPFRASGKALASGETEGLVKIVADATYGQILGAYIVGPHATEMIAELVLAIRLEATVDDIAAAVHPHPTLSEAVMEAALDASGRAFHI